MILPKKKYDTIIDLSKDDGSLYKIQDGITEINVESPAPAFKALRNRLDFELLKANVDDWKNDQDSVLKEQELWLPEKYFHIDTFDTLQESDIVKAAAKAKITPIQMHISYELFKLESLHTMIQNDEKLSETDVEALKKKYRLMVKKRLNTTNREILGRIHTKADKQKELASIFDDVYEKYQEFLRIKI